MDPEEDLFDLAVQRIARFSLALGAAGAAVAFAWRGWACGAGFALGAGASWLNFRWLKSLVNALGSRRPTRKRVAVLAGLRWVILGAGAYVILRFTRISVGATLAGLFVVAAAVIAEILYQLVYARN